MPLIRNDMLVFKEIQNRVGEIAMSQKYYDGPVKDTERGLEELEKSIEEEKERCKKMNSWEDAK